MEQVLKYCTAWEMGQITIFGGLYCMGLEETALHTIKFLVPLCVHVFVGLFTKHLVYIC